MPRPKSKVELIKQSQNNFEKLRSFINAMPDVTSELPLGYMNRNVRDVLAHLHHWHTMFLTWYDVGMGGGKPQMPAEGYTWRTVPQLNRIIWETYSNSSLEEVSELLELSCQKLQCIIENHSDEELFTKKLYKWTGSTSLASYLISATSSHYDWALKLIRKIE